MRDLCGTQSASRGFGAFGLRILVDALKKPSGGVCCILVIQSAEDVLSLCTCRNQ